MNLKSTSTNGFNCRMINSLMGSRGVRLTWLDCKIGTISGAYTEPLKVTSPATPIIMQNLLFSDYALKMTVEAPVSFFFLS